ncbi:50S ribosome-binding GTPase [Aeromonas sobria]|nr:50S ribosome-binding GTPase [Aeromonas sobria]
MENTLNSFKEIKLLERLKTFLEKGKEIGIDIDFAFIRKLQNNLKNLDGDKLKVALVGGFSEGKTSIAAAWMEKFDKSSMKISHQESSNEVKVYEVGSDFVLIDTPGLFGFKDQFNTDTNTIEKYKDITKKHVSEAHLVLYVMNSTNPIKESHKEDLQWLFRSLNLLSRTVFVLSRFDEVADVEDEEDYLANFAIKKENITNRLNDMIDLEQQELESLSIVAVAANPFDQGLDYWLNNMDDFKKLSHISNLQEATNYKIQACGGTDVLNYDMRASIISDVIYKQLPVAIETDAIVAGEVDKLCILQTRLQDQLATTQEQIKVTRRNLREFVLSYFTDLIMQVKGCSLETFSDFCEREIGSEGIVLNQKLQNEFERQMGSITLTVEKMNASFDGEVTHFNATLRSLGKDGINHVLSGNLINNQTIIATRDGIVTVAKTIGFDIGKALNFNPWGAVNLAKGLNGALAVVGVALELWDSYQRYEKEQEFVKVVSRMESDFKKQQKELVELIDSVEFEEKFFGTYIELKNKQAELNRNILESQERQKTFADWRAEGESIAGEFVALKKG